ncbi:MAG: DUF502 domain-containing protein [Hyphomonadaceae bacterium]|nr:DUF502 domain-containing protein [Hyphomonadaceae bacterium]
MTETPEEEQLVKKHGLFTSIRNSFFAGVVVALPIGLTIWLITSFVGFVDNSVLPLIPKQVVELIPQVLRELHIPGLGILISFVVLWGLGVIATNFLGSRILRFGERILARVPVVSNIYNAVKQIVVTMAQQKERAFRDVCLIEYPRKGLWAIGFVTADLKGAPSDVLPDGHVCVFVPTTPNPTSGFLLFVKIKDIVILDMTPEEGAKMIISGGMVTSNADLEDGKKR